MTSKLNKFIFLLFFLSGFCGLLYQVVWVRLAFTSFGVITPVLSVIVSVFMLGLALGSFWGGRIIAVMTRRFKKSPLIFYAVTELFIGAGAFAVPRLFAFGETLLDAAGAMDSFRYLFFSDVIIAISILPWCILMGFTYPFMMFFIKNMDPRNRTSFSYLYLANVLGAMCGASLTAWVLIELLGFRESLMLAASLNFLIFISAFAVGLRFRFIPDDDEGQTSSSALQGKPIRPAEKKIFTFLLLFFTGFCSMAMEIVWVRSFTPVLMTTIYAFASLLTVYLFATWVGSFLYRRHARMNQLFSPGRLLGFLAIFSVFPVFFNDPRLMMNEYVVLFSIFPFCAALGYLTPFLIDDYAHGNAREAGKAYAVNIVGCVAGPLFASYWFLPHVGEKFSLILLGLPFGIFFAAYYKKEIFRKTSAAVLFISAVVLMLTAAFVNISYEDAYLVFGDHFRDFQLLEKGSVIRRDHTATVINAGEGLNKRLLVNGIGITKLTQITKMMAHLPLAFLEEKPSSALIICLGMGTTFRSALSWNIKTTAVELVPSVRDSFGYYFDDAEAILNNPLGAIVVDDGRRFLKRTGESYDIITIDPPPPPEAAGSSLLYSEEFYALVKKRLKPHGILQQWFPCGELKILQAVARSLSNAFPYVKVYKSAEGWGFHFLASNRPIEVPSAQTMLSRIPRTAKKDLAEWFLFKDEITLLRFFRLMLSQEIPFSALLNADQSISITDDRPFNEYFFLRRTHDSLRGRYKVVICEPAPAKSVP